MSHYAKLHRALVAAAIVGFAVACADQTSPTTSGDPLKDLVHLTADTGSAGPGEQPTPGAFHGRVLGQSTPGAIDTLDTATRVANVLVKIYSHVQVSTTDTLGVGPEVARTTTDGNGDFQTPTLPGALYIVTFTPPVGSPYRGVYVVATAFSRSGDYPWLIVLPKQ